MRKAHEAFRDAMQARMFEHLDADGNGSLSRAEFGRHMERLKALDADADGTVSRDELRAGMAARQGKPG
jgi:Ca2+-binding EF-hand superfamily protein